MPEQILALIYIDYRLFIDNGWQSVFLLAFAGWIIWACFLAVTPTNSARSGRR
jgi:hypothetical protein